ncbi:hypothetical protein LTR60_001231, partial [Cryomyces antarcticus]
MTSNTQTFAEKARAAELASARASRKTFDGVDLPPSAPIQLSGLIKLKPSSRNKGAKAWKPLNLADLANSNDDGSSLRKDTLAEPLSSDDSDFQLVTGRRMHAGTNSSQSTYLDKDAESAPRASVAGSYNKHEVNEIFGNELPGPDYLQQTLGTTDGQIQFIQHPNGDISAQQWSVAFFQWTNIGQYSNIRKKIEGQLASERLRGTAASNNAPQLNTLKYFRAVSKQREAIAMGIPLGPRASEPSYAYKSPKTTSGTRQQADSSRDRSPSHVGSQQASQSQTYPSSSRPNFNGVGNAGCPIFGGYRSSLHFPPSVSAVSQGEDPFIASIVHTSERAEHTGEKREDSSMQNGNVKHSEGTGGIDFEFRFPQSAASPPRTHQPDWLEAERQWNDMSATRQHYVEQERTRIQQTLWPQQRQKGILADVKFGEEAATARMGDSAPSDNDLRREASLQMPPPPSMTVSSRRNAMKEYLNKLGDQATARGNIISTAARTVLHDPLLATSSAPTLRGSEYKAVAERATRDFAPSGRYTAWSRLELSQGGFQPPSSSGSADGNALRVSDPEPGWKERPVEIVNIATPKWSNAELAALSIPTPQNFNGPFFTAPAAPLGAVADPYDVPKHSRAEDNMDWWTSRIQRERQEEYLRSLKATNPNPAVLPGFAPKKSTTKPLHPSMTDTEYTGGMDRVLLRVYENLSSYVQGPHDPQRDDDPS